MGPLLFNIFIDDIFFVRNDINIHNYVDDNCISFSGSYVDIIRGTLERNSFFYGINGSGKNIGCKSSKMSKHAC